MLIIQLFSQAVTSKLTVVKVGGVGPFREDRLQLDLKINLHFKLLQK